MPDCGMLDLGMEPSNLGSSWDSFSPYKDDTIDRGDLFNELQHASL